MRAYGKQEEILQHRLSSFPVLSDVIMWDEEEEIGIEFVFILNEEISTFFMFADPECRNS